MKKQHNDDIPKLIRWFFSLWGYLLFNIIAIALAGLLFYFELKYF